MPLDQQPGYKIIKVTLYVITKKKKIFGGGELLNMFVSQNPQFLKNHFVLL